LIWYCYAIFCFLSMHITSQKVSLFGSSLCPRNSKQNSLVIPANPGSQSGVT
jgi:hypothetical protein